MKSEDRLDDQIGTIASSAVLIWWGLAFLIDPITIGMAAVGTGLILIGANAARHLKGLQTRPSTTNAGLIAVLWGTMDHVFALSLGASLAVMLIVIGLATLKPVLSRPQTS